MWQSTYNRIFFSFKKERNSDVTYNMDEPLPGVMIHICNPSTLGGSQIQGQPELRSEFQASLSNVARLCLKQQQK
jgi:hypothetical protein